MIVSSMPALYRVVSRPTGMGDRLRACITHRYVASHPGQLSLLPSMGREMSTGQSAVMAATGGQKAGWLIPFVDKRVGGKTV